MPRGGHNKLPTRVKVIRGTNRPCRANPNEPKPDAVDSVEPVGELEGEALAIFETLVADVAALGVLHEEHRHKLTIAAILYAKAIEPGASLEQITAASREFRQLVSGYGLDPATMSKVGTKKEGEHDPMLKLLKDRIG